MNIQEAIEIKSRKDYPNLTILDREIKEADRLSIEALKDKLKARSHGHAYSSKLLPGETEE